MKKSVSVAALLALNANWAGLSFMWNALHPIVLPALLVQLVPADSKNTYLGLLTFSGLVIAMVLQPISGALSDRWRSRYGRRRPLLVIGTLFDAVFLMLLASSTGFTGLVLGYMGLQLSSNTAQGPLQGLMRDRVPHHQLGVASSMKVFLDLASLVAASLVAGRLITINPGGATLVMLAILGLLVASAAVTILFSPEQSSNAQAPIATTVPTGLEAAGPRDNSKYWWLIGQRAAFLFGVYGLQAFGQYYIQDALGLADAPRQAGNLLAIIGTGTIALVVAGGFLADRFGARRLLYFSSALAGTGMLLMSLTTDLRGLYASGSIVGAGIGLFLTSNWALANQLAPLTEAGKFLGLTNLATAGAAALARLEGPAVDFLNGAHPGEWLGYKGIFLLGSVCIALSTWFLSKVR